MGTKMHFESYLPGYYSMRNLSEDSNGGSWPLYSGDKNLANGQYYNGFLPKGGGGGYSVYEKDVLKQKMLEHDAIFRSQVYELHRLYKIQRDLIDEISRKELQTYHIPGEASVLSSPLGFQLPSKEIKKWHNPGFPLVNSISAKPLVSSAENSHSHLSSIENKSSHVGPEDSQNGGKSMDCEILGCRPTKVRRKMFDLQLPAEHFIDTEEVEHSGNKMVANSGDVKVFNASLSGGIGLADLNEPFKVEEANTPGSLDIQGNGSLKFLPNGTSQKLILGRDIMTSNNPQIENKGSGREWMSYMFEAGRPKNNLRSDNQGFKPEKFPANSQPSQAMLNKVDDCQTLYPTDPNKEDFWRERSIPVSGFPERNNDRSQAYQYGSSYDPAKSWSHSIPMWDNPISNINQPAMLVESHPCFSLSARLSSSHSSVQNHGIFGEKLHFNGNSPSSSGFRSDALNRYGLLYKGSSSGSKGHLTSTGFDNLNNSNGCDNVADEQINLTSTHCFNASNHIDLNFANHMKLDLMHSHKSNQLSNKTKYGNGQGKSFTQIITLASCPGDARFNGVDIEPPTTTKILGFPIFGNFDNSMNNSAAMNSPSSVICPSKGEIFDDSHKNGLLDINCPYDPAISETGNDKNGNFVEKQGEKEVDSSKHFIDLNSCISDDQALLTSQKSYSSIKKIEIDLEAPLAPESQDIFGKEWPQDLHITSLQPLKQKAECTQDERATLAAEAIVAISSYEYSNPSENETSNPLNEGLIDPLCWFVDVISSCANDHEVGKHGDYKNESSFNGLDYFESMTLKLTEENIDEYYLSEYRVTQNPKVEETGNNLLITNRRKGQARRGRQKRDFQRDILPVIASLSRHEVREDLHTFEGLVKATGVTWHSSLTRRAAAKNRYGRGRRQTTAVTVVIPSPVCSLVIPKAYNIEMGLEDRSLTGWGKTTRRPRRQRGPAGNPPPIPLT